MFFARGGREPRRCDDTTDDGDGPQMGTNGHEWGGGDVRRDKPEAGCGFVGRGPVGLINRKQAAGLVFWG